MYIEHCIRQNPFKGVNLMKHTFKKNKIYGVAALKILEQDFNVAWSARDLSKCIDVLEQVLRINPRNTNALLLRGRLFGVQYHYDEACECFDEVLKNTPSSQRMSMALEAGRMSSDFYDPVIAEFYFHKALEFAGSIEAKLALAEHCIRMRKHEVSKTLVDEVIKKSPQNLHAQFLWCRLNDNLHDNCIEKLSQIIKSENINIRIKGAYQMAMMMDRAGEYDEVMKVLQDAKSQLIQSKHSIVNHRRKIRLHIQKLTDEFTQLRSKEWQDEIVSQVDSKCKLALLGGHPRSGTTLLEQIMDSHPSIISAEETENFNIFAFTPLMKGRSQDMLYQSIDSFSVDDIKLSRKAYFEAMERCLNEDIRSYLLIDKNPSLTPLAPALLRVFPEIKFIVMIRDPRDVVLSCYMQSFQSIDAISGNFLTLQDTAEEVGFFINTWMKLSGKMPDRTCEVRYEQLIEDLEGTARKVLGFLGLEWNQSVMDYDRHAREKVVRSPTAEAVTEKIHTRAKERWKNYEKHLEPIFEKLDPCLAKLGYS